MEAVTVPKAFTIINADDFGLSESVNRAISEAFKSDLISNTTMLANGEAFDEAVRFANDYGFADKVGIHFNLTEGKPLTDGIKDCPAFCNNGVFHGRIKRLKPLSREEKNAVYDELSAQAKKIKSAGFGIDHADSHHHIHTAVFIAPLSFRVCREFGIEKIRIHRNVGSIPSYKKFVKDLYNKNLRKNGFKTTAYFGGLDDIKNAELPESLEIMVHPDYSGDKTLIDRRRFADGIPSGVPLYNPAAQKGIKLNSYGDL